MATFRGSSMSRTPRGFPEVTAQKRHPRVHVSPMSMIVAVPPPQHSPTFGQWASSHTVWRSRDRRSPFRRTYVSPAGGRTRSHSGFLSSSIRRRQAAAAYYVSRAPRSSGRRRGRPVRRLLRRVLLWRVLLRGHLGARADVWWRGHRWHHGGLPPAANQSADDREDRDD